MQKSSDVQYCVTAESNPPNENLVIIKHFALLARLYMRDLRAAKQTENLIYFTSATREIITHTVIHK